MHCAAPAEGLCGAFSELCNVKEEKLTENITAGYRVLFKFDK
jgi:hypothetical protein